MRKKSEAQVYLEQVERLDARIKNKLIEKQQWFDLAVGLSSGGETIFMKKIVNGKEITEAHNMEKVQSSGNPSKMSDAVSRCVDMEAEIDLIVAELVATKKEVIQTIERLDNATEYNVLHMRYIQFRELQEIADHYGKDYGWVTTCHGRALKNVQRLLNERKRIEKDT